MFREIREWIHLFLLYGLLYSSAVIILVLGVVHLKENNTRAHAFYTPQKSETIIYNITQDRASGYEHEVCNRVDGCVVKNGVCLTCIKTGE